MTTGYVVLLGGGESGTASALLAQQQGWEVFVSEQGSLKPAYREELQANDIAFEENGHTLEKLQHADLIVKSPGIPQTANTVMQLREKGIPILSDLELAFRFLPKETKLITVTGSNGKTTTSRLIYEMLLHGGFDVGLCGNIGTAMARMMLFEPHTHYVVEASSFQLEDIDRYHTNIAVITNVYINHLDRYNGSMLAYAAAKLNILRNQTAADKLIYNLGCSFLVEQIETLAPKAERLGFSFEYQEGATAWMEENQICMEMADKKTRKSASDYLPVDNESLSGKHNKENAMAASIVGNLYHMRNDRIRESFQNFENSEHRIERFAEFDDVQFINDSKATNAAAAWYALNTMTRPVVWIAGGVDKGNDYGTLLSVVKEKVAVLIAMGKLNDKLIEAFEKHVPKLIRVTNMEEAVAAAIEVAEKGQAVLLAPACASFDLFDSFEDRGEKFKEAVENHFMTLAEREAKILAQAESRLES